MKELDGAIDAAYEAVQYSIPSSMVEDALRAGFSAARSRDIVCCSNEDALIGAVMMLTGGWANPNVVRHQIERVKKERFDEH